MAWRVLELYAGIGGMHLSLKRTGHPFEIVRAIEINPTALQAYAFNFPGSECSNRNINSLSAAELNNWNIDLIAMSPPCQPFCRSGLKLDRNDERTRSLLKLLEILPDVNFKYILLENVNGFQSSECRDLVLECLRKCGFEYQEFLLTPTQLDVPNSRLRYYMIGKEIGIPWCFNTTDTIMTEVPFWILDSEPTTTTHHPYLHIVEEETALWNSRRRELCSKLKTSKLTDSMKCIGDVIATNLGLDTSKYEVPRDVIQKYGVAMDIVNVESLNSMCFTKSYGRFAKGTGSIFDEGSLSLVEKINGDAQDLLCYRYFTENEVMRLMCFPETYTFPESLSLQQSYSYLGNSVNVYVISILFSLLLA